jgi:hypothetical protein
MGVPSFIPVTNAIESLYAQMRRATRASKSTIWPLLTGPSAPRGPGLAIAPAADRT